MAQRTPPQVQRKLDGQVCRSVLVLAQQIQGQKAFVLRVSSRPIRDGHDLILCVGDMDLLFKKVSEADPLNPFN
jgi:hypothetical protein